MRAASDGTRLQQWFERQRLRPAAPTRAWHATLALAIGVLLFGIKLMETFPATGAGFADGYGAPVLAFEFVRGQADLLAVFGPEGDPLQVPRLAAMRAGNEGGYLFMLLYAAFLGSGLYALWRETRLRTIFAATVLPVAAACCDAYENALLFDIQSAFTLGDYSPAMASLPWPVGAKFLLLGATNLMIGHAMMQFGARWQLAAALVMAPVIAIPMALVAPADFGWTLPAAIGGGWIGLLAVATVGSWRALARGRPIVNFDAAPPPRPAPVTRPDAPVLTAGSFGRKR